jgi:hypothetical protein
MLESCNFFLFLLFFFSGILCPNWTPINPHDPAWRLTDEPIQRSDKPSVAAPSQILSKLSLEFRYGPLKTNLTAGIPKFRDIRQLLASHLELYASTRPRHDAIDALSAFPAAVDAP